MNRISHTPSPSSYREKPLAIDLFSGLGGWTEGLLAEGYDVVGFDIEQHIYGEARYPAQLVRQDVLTLHGSQFKDAALIVASPPCQAYSYMAMPWTRAKQIAAEYRDGTRDRAQLTALFDACFRIQREASAAAGRHIPMVVENVRGAQPWVGRADWAYGSFLLWGDVPALMPIIGKRKMSGFNFNKGNPNVWGPNHVSPSSIRFAELMGQKNPGFRFDGSGRFFQSEGVKLASDYGRRTDIGNGTRFTSRDCGIENSIANAQDGNKQRGSGPAWWRSEVSSKSSTSNARKAASAHIAKIPYPLARWIARAWWPSEFEPAQGRRAL